ncbi:MAG: AI-2E family transporter [Ferruginibacter sp.]
MLLLPVTNFLERKLHFPKIGANLFSVILALFLIAALIYFFSREIASFLDDIPTLRKNMEHHYETLQKWVSRKFDISLQNQSLLIDSATTSVKDSGTGIIGQTVFTITNTLFYIILIAIYSFLILHYRHMIKRFLVAVFNKEYEPQVNEVLIESKGIVQKYMLGLIIEMGIISVLNTAVLLIIGVDYAIFLGIFAGILNIIPYIGIIMGILFAVLVTLTTSASLNDIIWIIISFEVIHFFDSNLLMPRIVGSKVKINALITIIGVVIGGTLIGLPGIFLALPTIAILKIIFDRVEDLKPWGRMMGDDTEVKKSKLYLRLESIRVKKKVSPVANDPDNVNDIHTL